MTSNVARGLVGVLGSRAVGFQGMAIVKFISVAPSAETPFLSRDSEFIAIDLPSGDASPQGHDEERL
jgi:hypothetical protein